MAGTQARVPAGCASMPPATHLRVLTSADVLCRESCTNAGRLVGWLDQHVQGWRAFRGAATVTRRSQHWATDAEAPDLSSTLNRLGCCRLAVGALNAVVAAVLDLVCAAGGQAGGQAGRRGGRNAGRTSRVSAQPRRMPLGCTGGMCIGLLL